MSIKTNILFLAFLLSLFSLVLPYIKSRNSFVRFFDFPRPQFIVFNIFFLCIVFFLLSNSLLKYSLSLFISINLFVDFLRVKDFIPYLISPESHQSKEKSDHSIKLLSANIHIKNKRYKDIQKLIGQYKPNIVLLIETDSKWDKSLQTLEKDYPYSLRLPQDNTYGMLLYSNLPLTDTEKMFLNDDNVPSIKTKVKVSKSEYITLFCLHPRPPRPNESSSLQRDGELAKVAKIIQSFKEDESIIVIGDLNDVAWSKTTKLFKRLTGLCDPRVGRGFYNTFPVKFKAFSLPLDHAFHSKDLLLNDLSVLESVGSDHYPILIDLEYHSKNSHLREKPSPRDLKNQKETLKEAKDWDGVDQRVTE